ncbi:hypothetical protein PF007_g27400 [Phytophthora fragariae]|uniref:Uncharacterized protein n=1 Tax=Phytophthora fragariae TaxID=53985 RepID=A0A6A3Q5D6_9STRA|nr:hypothetical protein PF003_g40450 [Phytophthora fragariae]KAE9069228.1 hypothetical protein PF007_g27400 [Phytophthora fragariae]
MDVSGHVHAAATVAVGGLAAGGHGRQRALGDHVAGFAGDHTPAAVAVGVLAVGDMDGSGRPEPMSLPESMSTPLLLLLRSASSRSGLWTSEGTCEYCAAEAAWTNSTSRCAAASSSTRATFWPCPRESALLAGLSGSDTYSGLSANLRASDSGARSSALESGGATKVTGRPYDVGGSRGGAHAGGKLAVGEVLVVRGLLRTGEAVGVSGVSDVCTK